MGQKLKGLPPREYRPSTTRRASGLARINESSENALNRWRRAVRQIKTRLQIDREIRNKGFATRGRFNVRISSKSPSKNTGRVSLKPVSPGLYFKGQPYNRGRFKVENIYGFVPTRR
jgi:hypothetical protein